MATDRPSLLMVDLPNGNTGFYPGTPAGSIPAPPASGDGFGFNFGSDDPQSEACRLVAVNLSAYLDSELDADLETIVEDHLNHCADCATLIEAMEATDSQIKREWRDIAPLPSSSKFKHSVDSIMAALPGRPERESVFASKRIHARTRWVRFATALTSLVAFSGMLFGSYLMGFQNGKQSSSPRKSVDLRSSAPQPKFTLTRYEMQQSASIAVPPPRYSLLQR